MNFSSLVLLAIFTATSLVSAQFGASFDSRGGFGPGQAYRQRSFEVQGPVNANYNSNFQASRGGYGGGPYGGQGQYGGQGPYGGQFAGQYSFSRG